MRKFFIPLFLFILTISIVCGYFLIGKKKISLPLTTTPEVKELPLLKYTIENLRQREYQASSIKLEKLVKVEPTFASFTFSFQTLNKKMTGLINIPIGDSTQTPEALPVLLLVRGYIPPAQYQPGAGTKNVGEFFASHGYVTLAPDFFGFADSDKESSDEWEARFQKPISVIELYKTIYQTSDIEISPDLQTGYPELPKQVLINPQEVGMWAHSNGGQIALTALEIGSFPIPTTLWAPVTAPFPYSVLYFSDEEADEGKASRKWIAQFEQDYDVFQFSIPQHLNLLTGPLQLHQGVADEAIHYVWSDEFVDKIKAENKRRKVQQQIIATSSAKTTTSKEILDPIEINYFKYPNSNHNMQPDWGTVIQRDLEFFNKNLKHE